MTILLIITIGLVSSFIGVIPPGIINMSVVKIRVSHGKKEAILFALGATLVVFFQSFIGVYFAKYLLTHRYVIQYIQIIGVIVFVLLTLFFVFSGIKSTQKITPKTVKNWNNYFVNGLALSALNLFPLPYYAFVGFLLSNYLSTNCSIEFSVFLFSISAVVGTLLAFILYMQLFKKMERKLLFITQNINFIIAFITGMVAVITLYNLL